MYNQSDIRQIRTLVEYRRQQIALDSSRTQRPADRWARGAGLLTRVRLAIGTGLIRAGTRIAGTCAPDRPYLRPGV